MNTTEITTTVIQDTFQFENIHVQEVLNYLKNNDCRFGICEETEDLEILKKSYGT